MILIGIGLTAILGGLTSFLLVRAQLTQVTAATQWMVGSLNRVSWTSVWPLLAVLVVLLPFALTQSAPLEINQLGDEFSTGLGVAVQRHRLLVIATAAVLAGVAVSAAGPVEFVAFVAPQVAAGWPHRASAADRVRAGGGRVGADRRRRRPCHLRHRGSRGHRHGHHRRPYLIWLITRHNRKERR